MVEMALVLPVLLLVLTGILTFGLAFNNYVILTEATSVGARALAISRGATTDPCATASSAVIAAAPLLVFGQPFLHFCAQRHHLYRHLVQQRKQHHRRGRETWCRETTPCVTVTYPCSLAVYGANYAPTVLCRRR